ncbi:SAF domain-containing protein [Janibacter sp. YB324]|uniref:SAF domain-containing protein n=1 Tax=Janibacter sp. YB324 TaxID=2761047 RepID=UPI0016248D9B|nr:SAF domain-containing protein [Janibacter sp. YB324]QNF93329.1 hypothetical protein H7A72_11120 [Janibacter sp. YB324]
MSVELASETTAPAAGPPVTRSASEQVSAVKPRRNMRLVLLGVAMAVVFALLAVWAVNRAGEARSVVVVTKDVQAGDQLRASDLATTQIRGGEDVSTVSGQDLGSLVGRRTTRALPAGTLVDEASFVQRITPRSGDAIVPISVTSAQYPASGLERGDTVRVVVTGGGQSIEGLEPGTAFTGVVLSLGEPDEKGSMTVDVSIASGDAPSAAAAAGTGRVAILNVAPGGTGATGEDG